MISYMILLYVCFSLKTLYLIYVVDWLALNAQPTALQLRPECSWPNMYFLCEAYHSLLPLRDPRGHFATGLGVPKKVKLHKIEKNMLLNILQKDTCLHMRTEIKRQSTPFSDLNWDCVCGATPISSLLCIYANDHKSPARFGFGVTHKF